MELCGPAKFYAILSTVSLLFIIFQNIGSNRFCLGVYSCPSHPIKVIFWKILYIIFWTWIITLLCKLSVGFAWFFVLIPFILVFLLMGTLFKVAHDVHEQKETTHPEIHSCIHCGRHVQGFCSHCGN